jgi:arginyl-tRNA synthetase
VEKAALTRAQNLLSHELMELAQAVHQFYSQCRVVGAPAPALARARLALVAAARQTISNGLSLLGVTAPERM